MRRHHQEIAQMAANPVPLCRSSEGSLSMGRVARVWKIEEWTKRLTRFEAADITVARFRRREGVSGPSFFAWKKKLRQAASSAGYGNRMESPVPTK